MRVDTTQYTYDALLSYACSRGDQTFSATQKRLLWWFGTQFGLVMSRDTLSRHLQALQAKGMVRITYRGRHQAAVYHFPDGVVTRQRVKFLPIPSPGTFTIEDDGVDVLRESEPLVRRARAPGLYNFNSEPLTDADRAILARMPETLPY